MSQFMPKISLDFLEPKQKAKWHPAESAALSVFNRIIRDF